MGEVYSSPSIDENSMSSRNEHCECHTKNAKETKTQEMQREKTHETKVVQRMNDILQVRPSYIFTCKGANLTPQLPCPSFHTGHTVPLFILDIMSITSILDVSYLTGTHAVRALCRPDIRIFRRREPDAKIGLAEGRRKERSSSNAPALCPIRDWKRAVSLPTDKWAAKAEFPPERTPLVTAERWTRGARFDAC
jgi:hypothetical protein